MTKERVVKACDFCGKEFDAWRADRRFCSSKCHDAYYHAKRAAKRAARRKKSTRVKEVGDSLLITCANCGRE